MAHKWIHKLLLVVIIILIILKNNINIVYINFVIIYENCMMN